MLRRSGESVHSFQSTKRPNFLPDNRLCSETEAPEERDVDAVSEFSDDGSESEDDLEAHLQLLRPRELEALGIDAYKHKQFEAAIKYLNQARLDWNEALVKQSLETGSPAEVRLAQLAIRHQSNMAARHSTQSTANHLTATCK